MIAIGGGNHWRDIEAIAHRNGITRITVYDDDPATGWPQPPGDVYGPLVIGVNDSATRRDIARRFSHLLGAAPLIDPSALIGINVHCGHGAVVGPMTSLLHSVTLGDHVHVNSCVNIVRSIVGDFSTISPGATIAGNVEIGEACTIGAHTTICERTKIGNAVTVGAGAIVPPYSVVPDNLTITGVWKNV